MSDEHLSDALKNEKKNFEEFYLWLQASMPPIFFQEVDSEWIPLIVHALMSFKVQDYFVEIHLRGAAVTLCFETPGADLNILRSYPHYGIKSYTTYISRAPLPFPDNPGLLRVGILHFTTMEERDDQNTFERFLQKVGKNRQEAAQELFQKAQENDLCQYSLIDDEDSLKLLVAWKNVPKHNFLYRLAKVVYQHGMVMKRVSATYLNPNTTHAVLMLSFGLDGMHGEKAREACNIDDFLREMTLLKYFGSEDRIEQTFVVTKLLSGNLANFLRSSLHFIHQVLVHLDPNLYSLENIEEALTRHPELTVKLCTAFENKFHPEKNNLELFQKERSEFNQLVKQLDTGHEMLDLRRKNVLLQAMNFVAHMLKTNFYCADKMCLAFRLDPHYLELVPFDRKAVFPQLPFALFFFKGMHFQGFHVRFKDLARGGLRTVYPEKRERVLAERNSVFLECYNLAYTQHKKNKDIPEGGAKGVIFLKPDEKLEEEAAILQHEYSDGGMEEGEIARRLEAFKNEQKLEYLYQTQRAYVRALLSLINGDESGNLKTSKIVDYWKKPEYIYLGPDENMHNVMIEWIASESKKEGYKPGGAFISGKSKVGINHKEYGVTSLGVNVYMHEALRYIGIDPEKDVFTVKMTGGPDGDVAGNQIHNLFRFYRNTAKLIALTDISGTINDPAGLDLEICKELFKREKSISHYPPDKLSEGGFLLDLRSKKEVTPYVFHTLCYRKIGGKVVEEWLQGNEMNALLRYNVHKTPTDIFIPCGGRPRTLTKENAEEFLDQNGNPTSKAVVEGANLYFSTEGRRYFEDKGVLIFKDSSANKCGVISSSFEILCGLVLKDHEFLEYKPQLVHEILERLKKLSFEEASLLLREHKRVKTPLSVISDQISERINTFTDQLLDHFDAVGLPSDPKDPLMLCLLHYCLPTLREKFGERVLKELPLSHKKAIIASHIASTVVYQKGLTWQPALAEVLPIILQELFS